MSLVVVVIALAICGSECHAADLQAQTADGQVVQGEYLGTEDNFVKIKTAYGMVSIPSKDIVSLTAVESPPKSISPRTSAPSLTKIITAKTVPPEEDPLVFKEPKGVVLASLLASRMPFIPEAVKQNRIDLVRFIRNFSDSSDASRGRIIRTLQNYGLMAYPFVEAAYTGPGDLPDKIELLQSVALPHRPFNAGLLAVTHVESLAELSRTALMPPPLPPEILTMRSRTVNRGQMLRAAARDVRTIESYAAISGGPFNTLFLLNVYRERYSAQSDPLLRDLLADSVRLATVARDHKNKASGWTLDDRILLIELALPLYFSGNDELRYLTEDFLKAILPEKHPPMSAEQGVWVEWWRRAKKEMK